MLDIDSIWAFVLIQLIGNTCKITCAQRAEQKIQEKFKVCGFSSLTVLILIHIPQALPCKISFTFDAWTSRPGDPYLSITAHYIDAPGDKLQDWELKTEQLAFKAIEGRHTGMNMARVLFETIDSYKIQAKVNFSYERQ